MKTIRKKFNGDAERYLPSLVTLIKESKIKSASSSDLDKLKEKVDGQWESITSFMPHIPDGQTVYFSRTFKDSVWLIKLTGKRYESIVLGQESFE